MLSVAPLWVSRLAPETLVVPDTVSVMPGPDALKVPPVMVNPPLSVESAATDSVPPLIEIGSVLVTEWTD
ncbi:MAG: hypothetical protein ACYC61_27090, partial [Isosphaeraceae bacterium]